MGLLESESLTKSFGGLLAVDGLSFDVNQGEILGLIGPNGAGKTTVYNMVSGVLSPTRGRVIYKGEDITGLKPYAVARKGLVRTWQENKLFGEMSVHENMLVAYHLCRKGSFARTLFNSLLAKGEETGITERVIETLKEWGLLEVREERAKNLPHGHQRTLGIVMALAVRPELLLLDEPISGMTSQEAALMMNMIRNIRDRGTTILIVEHDMRAIMGLCDRIVVLNFGRKIADGSPQEIQSNPDVIEAYLGAELEA